MTTPEQESEQALAVDEPQEAKAGRFSAFTLISICLSVSAFAIALFALKQPQTTPTETTALLDLQENLNQSIAKQSQLEQQLAESLQGQRDLQKQLHTMAQDKHEPPALQWTLLLAKNQMALAQVKLNFEHDQNAAKQLMQKVKQELATQSNTVELLRQLEADIANVDAITPLDVASLFKTLQTLSQNFETMPTIAKRLQTEQKADAPATSQSSSAWQASLERFKDVVRIRRNDKPIGPLLSEAGYASLIRSLQLMVTELEYAILKRDETLFQNKLNEIAKWVTTYFDIDSEVVKQQLAEIAKLEKVNIQVESLQLQTLSLIDASLTQLLDTQG